MYQIKVFIILNFLVFGVYAAPSTLNFSYNSSDISGSTNVLRGSDSSSSSSKSSILNFSSAEYKNFIAFRASLNQIERDLSNYFVTQESGSFYLSEREDGKDSIGGLGFDLRYKDLTLSFDGSKSLIKNSLETSTFGAGLSLFSYDYGLTLSYNFSYSKDNRPENIVSDQITLRNLVNSAAVRKRKHSISYEQIVRDDLKLYSELAYVHESEARPANYSYKIGTLYALIDELGVNLEYERVSETGLDYQTKDNTGFYDLSSYVAGLSYEINYNLFTKLKFGTTIETESARGINPEQKIGTDFLSAGLEYFYKKYMGSAEYGMEKSNTDRSQKYFTVGLGVEL